MVAKRMPAGEDDVYFVLGIVAVKLELFRKVGVCKIAHSLFTGELFKFAFFI